MSLFGFKSPEEKRKEQQEYQRKIFPLGMEQRDAALSVLKDFVKQKTVDNEILYCFIVAKQKYLENDKKEEVIPKIAEYLKKEKFNTDEISGIIALVMLDSEVQSLGSYPTRNDIENFIKTDLSKR